MVSENTKIDQAISRAIAAIQLGGASFSLYAIASNSSWALGSIEAILLTIILIIVTGSAMAFGALLWNNSELGYRGSIVTQLLQIPFIASSLVTYKIYFGFAVYIELFGAGPTVNLAVGSSTLILFRQQLNFGSLSINIFALIASWYLLRRARQRSA